MDVFDLPDEKHIVAIGVNIYREGEDPAVCDFGFLFRKFDYCGNVIIDKRYGHFDSVTLVRSQFCGITDNDEMASYGYSGYNITHKNKYSYFAGLGEDAQHQFYNVLMILDENGDVLLQKVYRESLIQKRQVQHLILLEDGNILMVLRDFFKGEYTFRWLSNNGQILKEITASLPNDLLFYYSKISPDNQFYFTAKKQLDSDENTFMVIKLDTFGNMIWEYAESGNLGSAREIYITDTSLLICAIVYDSNLVEQKSLSLIELSFQGKLVSKRRIDIGNNYFMFSASLNFFKSSRGNYYTVANLYNRFPVQRAISIISLSSNLKLNWYKQFYKKDNISFGHAMTETSDEGLVAVGVLRQQRPNMYGSIIVKTTPEAPTGNFSVEDIDLLSIYPNPVNDYIYFISQHTNYKYFIYNLDGSHLMNGIISENKIPISTLQAGLFICKIIDNKGNSLVNKFIKL